MQRRALAFAAVLGATIAVSGRAEAQSPPPAPEKISVGDWKLSPSLQVRLRGEYRRDAPDLGGTDFYGRLTPRVRNAWVVMERSRLGLGVERGAVRAQITLQDARALGAPTPTATFAGAQGIGRFQPYEAYAEMRTSSARPAYLRLGRQAVVWGEGRLIGKADFSPVGRSLDAARGHFAVGAFDFEALAAILEMPTPLGSSFGDTAGPQRSGVQLYGLTAQWTLDPLLKVEAFGLARVARSTGVDLDGSRFEVGRLSGERFTGALRASGDAKGWAYGAEGAYQAGTASSVAVGGSEISAWAAAAHLQKRLDQLLLTPTFRVAGSYASGDDGRGGKLTQFDPMLPDPQRFHGQMDLFAWSNMADVSGRVEVVPWTDASIGVEYRYARLATAGGEWIGSYMNAIGRNVEPSPIGSTAPAGPAPTATDLGHEIDVVLAWRPWLPVELRAGYSLLLLGDAARDVMAAHARGRRQDDNSIVPADLSQYAFGQVTLDMP